MTRLNPFRAHGKKRCTLCREVKDFAAFDRSGNTHQTHCKPCRAAYRKNLRQQNRKWAREYDRRGNLRKYGITLEQWEALFDRQGRTCAICRRTEANGHGWHTDHCHATGKVRGILCHDCNFAIGAFERVIRPNLERFLAFGNEP